MKYKEYLALAIPFVISTVTQPLLGAVDTAVVGRLGNASYIGGVAIGAVIFNTLYWLFGFLRVSTSGFSAQSLGSGHEQDRYYAFVRPFVTALIMSLIFIACQTLIQNIALSIYRPEPEVTEHAVTYFKILIWGAPFVLLGYVNLGWLMGRKHVKETLFLQISMNVLNIILDLVLVFAFEMGVAGVAYATLISQFYGFVLGTFLICSKLNVNTLLGLKHNIFDPGTFKKMIGVNTDLFIRTVCLLVMTNMFVAKGAELGTVVLAANAVLFQLHYIICYMYDGIANASSVFAGKSAGEKNLQEYKEMLSISNVCTAVLSIVLSVVLILFKDPIIAAFTSIESVIAMSHEFFIWLIVLPFVIGVGLVYFGVFTGCTFTGPIRDSMILSLLLFLIAYYTLIPQYQNHGLWLAFILFSLGRSVFLFLYRKKLMNRVFPQETGNEKWT
ncbi:MATE family efflux transporter [Sporosarcina sp. FSL W7-1349]|uniref:MATE family efflux transporter n=1 Tax=Sporosarcina sp. FSL W7-1349 TaxID=2921561 RepID=UPI0030FBBE48